jgi:hypothetical protein
VLIPLQSTRVQRLHIGLQLQRWNPNSAGVLASTLRGYLRFRAVCGDPVKHLFPSSPRPPTALGAPAAGHRPRHREALRSERPHTANRRVFVAGSRRSANRSAYRTLSPNERRGFCYAHNINARNCPRLSDGFARA